MVGQGGARDQRGQSKLPLLSMVGGGILLLMAVVYVATGGLSKDSSGDDAAALEARCAFPACRAAADPGLARGYEGASIAVDPKDADHMVIVDAKMTAGHCTWHTTFDRGKEWVDGVFQEPEGYSGCRINGFAGGHVPSTPSAVDFAPSGKVFATYGSAHRAEDGSRESVIVAVSDDGGKKFTTSVAHRPPAELSFARPHLTVVPGPAGADRLLLTFWLCRESGRFCESVMFSRSDDGGATFTPPVVFNDPPAGQTPSAALQTPDGTIFATFARRYSDGPSELVLARSEDGGATWAYTMIDQQLAIGSPHDSGKLAFDPRLNHLYAVYSDGRAGTQQIFFRRSTDRGVTWSDALGIAPGQDAVSTGTSRTPSISVAPNGRVDIVYYRTPQANTDNVFWAYSIDGGDRFVSRQVNEKPIRRFEFAAAIGNWYAPDVASTDAAAYVVWSDTGNAPDQDQNVQDTFLRRMALAGDLLPP